MRMTKKELLLLVGVSLAGFIGNADFGIVNTAIPGIQTSMQLTFVQAQWIANAFVLGLGVFMIMAGKVADVLGRRRVFYSGLVIFLISSALAGTAQTPGMLIFARALLSVGSAIMFTSSGSLVAVGFGEQHRAKAMGIFWGIMLMGLACGPILGGIITHFLSWRWLFFINFPIVFISIILCMISIPASANERVKESIDFLGFALFAIFSVSLNLGVLALTHIPIVPGKVILYMLVSLFAFILFLWRQLAAKHPLLNIALFKQRRFVVNCFVTFALGSYYGLAFFIFPFYLNNARGLSILNVGLFLLPATVVLALISTYIGRVIEKGVSLKVLVVLGFLILSIASTLQLFFAANTSLWLIAIPLILLGVGWGLTTNPSSIIALEAGTDSMSGMILGTIWTILNIGSSLAVAVGTALFHDNAKSTLLQDLNARGFHFKSYAWVNNVISDPTHSLGILQAKTQLSLSSAQKLFAHYFMSGYHGAVLYLVVIGLAVFFITWFGLPRRNS